MTSRPPIQEDVLEQLSPAKRALLERRLARRAPRRSDLGPIPRTDVRPAPLSFEQQRLWLLDQLTPGTAAYNVPRVLRLRGSLDVDALQLALDALLERHEPLRTRFQLVDGNPVQVVSSNSRSALEIVDLTEVPRGHREQEALRLATETAAQPFDLAGELLLRTQLVRLDPTDHLLALVTHHIVSDEGSKAILFDDLATLYASFRDGRPSPLPAPALQYADYAAWQRGDGAPSADGLAWWRERLTGAPSALELPADRPRPPVQTHTGARYSSCFEPGFASELRALAQRERATPFMVMLTAFAVLANRLTGEDDLVIGAPVSGRDRPELERVIGCFGNTVALRLDASGEPTFAALLARTRTTAIDAFAHQDVPFERVVRELQPERDLSRSPVFQLMFNYFDGRAGDSSAVLAGMEVEQVEIDPGVSKFDLALVVAEGHDGLTVEWEYSTDLFERGTIERLHRRFERILRAAVKQPATPISKLPLLDAEEERELLEAGRGPRHAFPADACVHELIAATAAERPDAIAVDSGEHTLTYHELERRANGLAHRLIARGAGRGTLVGVCVDRCVELPVALLAVLKAGAAYIPLDPSYPKERLRLMLEDAGAPLVLASASLAGELPSTGATIAILEDELARAGRLEEGPPVTGVEATDLAYVIYTSGSTGRPKGVMIEHGSVVNFLYAMAREPGLETDDVLLAVTTLSFDIAVLELYLPLLRGARVAIASREEAADPHSLIAAIERVGASVMQATPATWRMLVDAGWAGRPGLRILCGGEALAAALADELLRRGSELWNLYGPTEATVWCAAGRVETLEDALTLGKPLANTDLHVLDSSEGLVPPGVAGELHVAGPCLARGYLGRPELTAERFIPSPLVQDGDGRLYRTGDLVRRRRDGALEFLGRIDHQVKLRGFRIELGEVEAALTQDPSVSAAVAVIREDTAGDRRLVAYAQSRNGECDAAALRASLRQLLPEYMVPSAIVPLNELPLTPNGKVDRGALPAPAGSRDGLAPLAPPRTELERRLAAIAADVLGRDQVGIHDDFFLIGGDSLLALRLITRINSELQLGIPVRAVFEAPTIARLVRLQAGAGADPSALPGPVRMPRGPVTVFPASAEQERVWFFELLEPGSALYNMPLCLQVHGELDAAALRRALDALVTRHEILRTSFTDHDGRLMQVVAPEAQAALAVVDVSTESDPPDHARRIAQAEAARPFDLDTGPLLRATLIHVGERDQLLCLTLHHIAGDARSLELLCDELGALYDALVSGHAPPPRPRGIEYGDYAVWQRDQRGSAVAAEQLAYWRERLAGAARLELPRDHERPRTSFHTGARHTVELGRALAAALNETARAGGSTLFPVLVAALDAALLKWTGESDLVIGTPVAGRTRRELEEVVGYLANTVALRTDASGDPTFLELVRRAREAVVGAFANQEVTFDRVVEELHPDRSVGRSPLFDVLLILQGARALSPQLGSLDVSLVEMDRGVARFDLTVSFAPRAEGLRVAFEYNSALFEPATIEGFADDLVAILERASRQPESRLSDLR